MKRRPEGDGLRMVLGLGAGGLLGIFLIHPASMAIYWFEYSQHLGGEWRSIWHFIDTQMWASFTWPMLPMTGLFAALGGLVSCVHLIIDARLRRSQRALSTLQGAVARDIPTLIRLEEDEHLEFKSTARWDLRQEKVNKALGDVLAKSIAAFANHEGGSLLVGVDDDGKVLGLEHDFRTLKKPGRDGFALLMMTLVRERLGGHVCHLVHVLFGQVEGLDVCRVVVEPSDEPVYFSDTKGARLFVRTGNASRELDARESVHYAASRWGKTGA